MLAWGLPIGYYLFIRKYKYRKLYHKYCREKIKCVKIANKKLILKMFFSINQLKHFLEHDLKWHLFYLEKYKITLLNFKTLLKSKN